MAFADAAARMLASCYRQFGVAAAYTPPLPPGGETVPCVLLTRTPEADAGLGAAGFRMSVGEQKIALTSTVRVGEVAGPLKDGVFLITDIASPLNGRRYEIASEPTLVGTGLEWSLSLRATEIP